MKKTLIDLFEASVMQYAQNTFLLEKSTDRFEPTTYAQARDQVYTLGAGFQALGVQKGAHMALLSEGRNAWIIGELAMFYAGAVNVPLSIKLEESNDLLFRLTHAEVEYILVSGTQLKKVRTILDQLPQLKRIIVMDAFEPLDPREISLTEVIGKGEARLQEISLEAFLRTGDSLENDDPATITYTSGTTADPKGVILTHRNYTANVEQALTLVNIDASWRTLIILPLDHCFAHVVGFFIFMSRGASVATVQNGRTPLETLKNIPLNIREVKPHLILSVPALAKNFRKNIEQGISAKGKNAQRIFSWGIAISTYYHGEGNAKSKGFRHLLKPIVSLFDKLIFTKVRENFGGELKFFIGGGALLDKELQKFYCAIGLPMYQGYGLSEATPVISSNGPRLHTFGSSGVLVKPLFIRILDNSGKELPIGEKGEIVIRGENVMAGYWRNPIATAETLREGWLYTGDLGYIGKDNLLYVLGRFKSLLIGSDGEKYSPEGIEEAIVEHSGLIDQIMLHNNQHPYTVALVVPNREALKKRIKAIPEKDPHQVAIQALQEELNRFKTGGDLAEHFPDRWLPTAFAILPDAFTEQNAMINSTLKMVRGKIEEAYKDRLAQLYTPEGKQPDNQFNREALEAI